MKGIVRTQCSLWFEFRTGSRRRLIERGALCYVLEDYRDTLKLELVDESGGLAHVYSPNVEEISPLELLGEQAE